MATITWEARANGVLWQVWTDRNDCRDESDKWAGNCSFYFFIFNFIGSHIKKNKRDDLRIPFLLNLLGMFFERHKFLKTCSFFLINESIYIYNYVIARLKISMIGTFNLFTDFERSICLLYIICATISSAIENVNFQN